MYYRTIPYIGLARRDPHSFAREVCRFWQKCGIVAPLVFELSSILLQFNILIPFRGMKKLANLTTLYKLV